MILNTKKTKELKKTTRYYKNKVKNINKRLDSVINEFDEKMKTTKKVIELEPKIQELFSEVNEYTKSHQTLEKENH